ncbi:MAG: signal peptidase I [Caldilineae bacterium]|nr:MAG: signal peptidase I [Caldilineae bacterium]
MTDPFAVSDEPELTSSSLPPDARIIRAEDQPERHQPARAGEGASGLLAWARGWASFVKETLATLLPALVVALLVHAFVMQSTRVESYSMEPTLYQGQQIIIKKISYRFRAPERGEIVVLHSPEANGLPLIKRVVGLPGETIAVHNGQVYIDGHPLVEPYLRVVTKGIYPETPIPADSVFVMGDNRNRSRDSRAFGPVSLERITGRALLRYWPLGTLGFVR